ncbi:MAG TPA: hypothetical protein PLJ27_02085 [Polyangiaceae bacterium]|nr:MAG: hypothetical protein BWY17_03323 [Deltaproteobacteria bacterium ADurb.Bin207]HOT11246.1 hypothetical protein [Polyangiaceae bacterium]HPB95734.1 hypothetical protein [Polyangiaceae bacterium]HPY16920.1 hypothetical protein [Polyangiaceae bacterium]HQF22330.1 hypothetical protein [Polyangiaceae bacterium]
MTPSNETIRPKFPRPSWPTRQIRHIGPLVLLMGWLGTGCHDDSTSDSTTADEPDADAGDEEANEGQDAFQDSDIEPATLDELAASYCSGMAATHCHYAVSCGCTTIPGFPSDCLGRYEMNCRRWIERFRDAVEQGAIVVHLAAVESCVKRYEQLGAHCALPAADYFVDDCPIFVPRDGFGPRAGIDASCEQAVCEQGLRCGSEYRCVTPGQHNDACATSADCDPLLICVSGRCTDADTLVAGNDCMSPDACEPGLSCLASAKSVCRETAIGEPCMGDGTCSGESVCATSSDGSQSECTLAAGEAQECLDGVHCATGLACAGGICAPKPQQGQPCALGLLGPHVCADGLSCVEGACETAPGEGQACGYGEVQCATGLGCAFEGADSLCRPKRGEGSACENDDMCLDELHCEFSIGQCEADLADGQACVNGNECSEGSACLPDEYLEFRCAPIPKNGESCMLDECADKLACRRVAEHGACAPEYCTAFLF